MEGIIETLYAEAGEPGGVLSSLPGSRVEAVPGPDGYSGCGLEKISAMPTRLAFFLSEGNVAELNSHRPLTDRDKVQLAIGLLKKVSL